MIGRKATVGLALLCAFAFCAFAAQAASAAGTTAYTCAKVSTPKTGQFDDAHCDKENANEEGEFKHDEIKPGTETEVTGSNEKTASETKAATTAVFHAIKAGVALTIKCTKVHSTGTLTNTEEAGVMHAGGTATVSYTGCTIEKPAKCTIKEPISAPLKSKTWEKGAEMGVEFTPKEVGKPFVELTIQGAECVLKGTFPVAGSIIGTPGGTSAGKGATLTFNATAEEEKLFAEQKPITGMQKLTFGGTPALLTSVETLEMKEATPTTGKAITLTTK